MTTHRPGAGTPGARQNPGLAPWANLPDVVAPHRTLLAPASAVVKLSSHAIVSALLLVRHEAVPAHFRLLAWARLSMEE